MAARGQLNSQVILGRHWMAVRVSQIVQCRLVIRVGKEESERDREDELHWLWRIAEEVGLGR